MLRYYVKPIIYFVKLLFFKSQFDNLAKVPQTCDCVAILPHEGIGDVVAILNGLNELAKIRKLKLLWSTQKWAQLKELFYIDDAIECVDFKHNKQYRKIKVKDLPVDETCLVKLGHYDGFPIHNYPSNFYFQLNVKQVHAREKLQLRHTDVSDFDIPKDFIYVNLRDSNRSYDFGCSHKNAVISTSNETLSVFEQGIHRQIKLPKARSLAINIAIALRANLVICTDAAIFNILVRLPQAPRMIVKTRVHAHRHDKTIYCGIKFNGKLYEIKNFKISGTGKNFDDFSI